MNKSFFLLIFLYSGMLSAQGVQLTIPSGHAKNIEGIATTSNGKYIATSSYKTIMVWDMQNKKKLYEISLDISLTASTTKSLSITDKVDKVLASTSGGLFCNDISTGKALFSKSFSGTNGAAFSKDGSKVYTVDYGSLLILDATNGNEINRVDDAVEKLGSLYQFYELANNQLLVVNKYGWSILNMDNLSLISKIELTAENDEMNHFSYDINLNRIVAASDEQGLVLNIFDINNGKIIKTKTLLGYILGTCVSNVGYVVFRHDNKTSAYKIDILKPTDLSFLKSTLIPESEVDEGIFYGNYVLQMPGNTKIIYNNNNEICSFDIQTEMISKPFQNRVTDFKQFYYYANLSQRLMSDNSLEFSTEDNGIRSFNMETFRPDKFIEATPAVIYSPDGKLAAGISQQLKITNRSTGKIVKTLSMPAGFEADGEHCFFHYNNTKIVFTNREKGEINAIDISTGLVTKLFSFGGGFYECSSSFDGKYFACIAGSVTDYLKVYNLETKQLTINIKSRDENNPNQTISMIKFLNDSYYLFANKQQNNVSIYKADEPGYISSFEIEHINRLSVLGGDIKNNIIAVGEIGQYQVGTYNLKLITKEGKIIREFRAQHNNDFLSAALSADDRVMFATTTQKGVQVWNTETGELIGTYYFIEKTNEYIFVSPEGLFDGSTEGMKELYFVKNNKAIPLEKLYEQFYTPDLLRRKLNGEKFTPPDVAQLSDPPKVSIAYAAVQRNLEVSEDMPTYQNTTGAAEITVTAEALEDAVDEIRLFHNGKIVTLVTRNLIVADDQNKTAVKKYVINLLPGQNSIRAIALNSQRTESDPDEIAVIFNASNNTGTDIKPIPNNNNTTLATIDKNATMHLIVVGINEYQNKSMSLNYALADATAFKDEIEKDAKSVINNVKTYFVTDSKADMQGIEAAFIEVQNNAKPEDVFLFYYAGHGVIGKNNEFYLVPTNVSNLSNVQAELEQKGIASKKLQQFAIDIPAQKQLFILDACQSAGAFEAMLTNDANQQKSIAVVARSTGTHWMAASGAQQFANEFASLGHGAFTYVLLEALKGAALNNKMITVNNLKNYLQQAVPEIMKQYHGTPQYPASYGFGNDFPVEVKE